MPENIKAINMPKWGMEMSEGDVTGLIWQKILKICVAQR